eukprot:822059-Pyramimonas_sp.AAC.1
MARRMTYPELVVKAGTSLVSSHIHPITHQSNHLLAANVPCKATACCVKNSHFRVMSLSRTTGHREKTNLAVHTIQAIDICGAGSDSRWVTIFVMHKLVQSTPLDHKPDRCEVGVARGWAKGISVKRLISSFTRYCGALFTCKRSAPIEVGPRTRTYVLSQLYHKQDTTPWLHITLTITYGNYDHRRCDASTKQAEDTCVATHECGQIHIQLFSFEGNTTGTSYEVMHSIRDGRREMLTALLATLETFVEHPHCICN